MATRLILIRHASVHPDYRGRMNGRADVPLAENHSAEMEAVAPIVRALGGQMLVSSPLSRASLSAQALGQALSLPVETDRDLLEADFGAWDGKTFGEIEQLDPDHARRFRQWDPSFAFPGGESINAFVSRIRLVTRKLCERKEEAVVAVTHGGVIRQMICHLLGLSPRQYLLFDVQCGKATVLSVFGDRGVLTGLNLCI